MKDTSYSRKAISLLLALIMLLGVMPLNIIVLGIEPSVTIQYNGADASSVSLIENGKVKLVAQTYHFVGDVSYQWQILADSKTDAWLDIGDRRGESIEVTYALVKSCLDANGRVYLRVKATADATTVVSEPVKIEVSYLVDVDRNNYVIENTDNKTSDEKSLLDGALDLISMPVYAADSSTETITITFMFLKVVNGVEIEIAYPDIRTLMVDYDTYTVNCPSVLGYTAPQPSYTVEQGQYTEDTTIKVIYEANDVQYTIKHWIQNANDDQYVEYTRLTPSQRGGVGKVDSIVPDCHIEIDGFEPIYYEHPSIAPDGTTVVDIYYDRVYYQVLFDYDGVQASGQNNVYVRYGTELGINDLESPGNSYIFQGWTLTEYNDGSAANAPAGVLQNIAYNSQDKITTVMGKLEYKALWSLGEYGYTILFWAENANDGNYSLWYSKKMDNPEKKTSITWDKSFLNYLEEYDASSDKSELEFFTFDEVKTKEGIGSGVEVRGDGTTVINVYYARRYYKINFVAPPFAVNNCTLSHTHGDGTCEYNAFHCTHIHTDECKSESCSLTEHTHTASCKTCNKVEHIHTPECCSVHIHDQGCYSYASDLTDGLAKVLSPLIEADIAEQYSGNFLAQIIGAILNWVTNDSATAAGTQAAVDLNQAAPPQNLQSGYVYILKNQTVHYEGSDRILGWIPVSVSGDVEVDIPAIYIEDYDGNPNNNWHYYTAPSGEDTKTGDVMPSDTCPENAPDHDHTGGCNYSKCPTVEHVHRDADGCYGCGNTEHQHTEYCNCAHEHTVDCYGFLCLKAEHNCSTDHTLTDRNGDGELNDKDYPVIKVLQAKYGQDITEYLPYYLELYSDGLHKNNSGHNFSYWKYDSTGTDESQAKIRYVKHLTMEADLCYSNGTRAVAVYDANANDAYVLYYLFESFDQESGAKDYNVDGSGRQQYEANGTWYDSDPKHMQLIMYNGAGGIIPDAVKTVVGMKEHSSTPKTGTLNFTIGSITSETLNAYFYDRDRITVNFRNPGDEAITEIEVPFGTTMGSLSQIFADIMGADWATNPESYPETLEKNVYEFESWYTTPEYAELSKIDWQTDTVDYYTQYLYARWLGIWRKIEIFTDSSMTEKINLKNSVGEDLGTQLRRHRGFAEEPPHATFNPAYGTSEEDYYSFVGWFYMDGGEEKAFSFDFAITDDMQIYPKWASSIKIEYKVNYVTEVPSSDGSTVYVEVANPYVNTAILGQNVTVVALEGTRLHEDYREGYFPEVGSSTIHITPDAQYNEYTFVYKLTHAPLEYKVEYRDLDTNELLTLPGGMPNPKTVKTMKNAETELFIPIDGYTVDKYAKTVNLIYYDVDNEETPNVLVFYYDEDQDEDPQQVPWSVKHYVQNLDGTYSRYGTPTETLSDVGSVQGAIPLDNLAGYEFARAELFQRTDEHPEGIVTPIPDMDANGLYSHTLGAYGMEINFYYERTKVDYTIQHVLLHQNGSVEIYHSETFVDEYVHGESITRSPDEDLNLELAVRGFTLMEGYENQSIVLDVDSSRNVISFYYQPWKSTFIYQIVASEDSGVGISQSREEINASPEEGEGLLGALPIENDKYYFVGWFTDKECTKPVVQGEDPVRIDADNRLVPLPTEFNYGNTIRELYMGATYYAKFAPKNADLTIEIDSNNGDSFIVTLVGESGSLSDGISFDIALVDGVAKRVNVPVGTYTVIINGTWSWRYGEITQSGVEVTIDGGGSFAIDISENENYKNSHWLDANGYDQSTHPAN